MFGIERPTQDSGHGWDMRRSALDLVCNYHCGILHGESFDYRHLFGRNACPGKGPQRENKSQEREMMDDGCLFYFLNDP